MNEALIINLATGAAAGLISAGVVWGSLRQQVRGLHEHIARQSGEIRDVHNRMDTLILEVIKTLAGMAKVNRNN